MGSQCLEGEPAPCDAFWSVLFYSQLCAGEGSCCEANGTPGCEDLAIQDCVCSIDYQCCGTLQDSSLVRDESCAAKTAESCDPAGVCAAP